MPVNLNKQIKQLSGYINASKNIIFFGGAGVSTESGIPDFRSENGLYSAKEFYGHSPEELLSYEYFTRYPDIFFRYYRENLVTLDAKPNLAHITLAKLEELGKVKAVITQNVDGLHQQAGSKNVFELHGSNHRQYCMQCTQKYTLEHVLSLDIIPKCECGGTIRPDIVMFGEQLDSSVMKAATKAIYDANLLIIGGTSLSVYPAAGLLNYFHDGTLVLINKSETHLDESADLVINAAIGEVLSKVDIE